jgi:activator of HSP90 ATPase
MYRELKVAQCCIFLIHYFAVWNHAGTWEERSFTAWATERLQQLCGSVTFETPIGQGAFVVSRIIDIVGDASITLARGKRKHIYDFVINLEWEVRINCELNLKNRS